MLTCLLCEKSTAPSVKFDLVVNLVYKDGQVGKETVVYEVASADG